MDDFLKAVFLGVVEGLTEFIPVSSTGHLIVASEAIHFDAVPGHLFEVFIQLGAILAVMVLYWRKIFDTLVGIGSDKKAQKFALNIIVATIPVLAAGFFAHDFIKAHLYVVPVIAAALVAGGIIILFLEKRLTTPSILHIDDIPLRTALLIGVFQIASLVPGVSRSGATIMGALALGLGRTVAAEFSFFVAIPVMWAAVLYDTYKNREALADIDNIYLLALGFAAAFLSALVVIKLMMHLINRWGFVPFAWYRIGAGVFLFMMMT